jgi:DNA mismatch repair ATPase MutS
MPDYFIDLNLDKIVDSITAGLDEYNLKGVFYTPLASIDDIEYRHEVFRDLESDRLFSELKEFAETMRSLRKRLASLDTFYPCFQKGWFLESAIKYCHTVTALLKTLTDCHIKSHALRSVQEYLAEYTASERFTHLYSEAEQLKTELGTVRYRISIKELTVTVSKCSSAVDYASEIEKSFDKFRQGSSKIYFDTGNTEGGMNQVEAKILECVSRLFPEIFDRLSSFMKTNGGFMDNNILVFEREIEFYLSYLTHIKSFQYLGLPFCLPVFSSTVEGLGSQAAFDLALAEKLRFQNSPIVPNDWHIESGEKIIVVTGPNQGGKTTFARAIGQTHHLANIGCPVPGSSARLLLFDNLFTHFEREETMKSLRRFWHLCENIG